MKIRSVIIKHNLHTLIKNNPEGISSIRIALEFPDLEMVEIADLLNELHVDGKIRVVNGRLYPIT